jgi:hypothetical protein
VLVEGRMNVDQSGALGPSPARTAPWALRAKTLLRSSSWALVKIVSPGRLAKEVPWDEDSIPF